MRPLPEMACKWLGKPVEGLSGLPISVIFLPPLLAVTELSRLPKEKARNGCSGTLECVPVFQEKGLLDDSWEPVMHDFLWKFPETPGSLAGFFSPLERATPRLPEGQLQIKCCVSCFDISPSEFAYQRGRVRVTNLV